MKWEWFRRLLVIAGAVYVWALLPVSIRPQIVDSPLKKSEQTITIDVLDKGGKMPLDAPGRIRTACRAPWPLRPIMSSADSVRVILRYNQAEIGAREFLCHDYVSSS